MPSARDDAETEPPFLNLGPGGGIIGGGADIICGAKGFDAAIAGCCCIGGADIVCGAIGADWAIIGCCCIGGADIVCGAIGADWAIIGCCCIGGADIVCGVITGAGVLPLRGGGGGGNLRWGIPGMFCS